MSSQFSQESINGASDADLVATSLKGDRASFSAIVRRHQTLVCSVAYSATGNLQLSEDLAQETFLTAWKRLRHLQEPTRLRAWLCGIVRRLANNTRRRLDHEPSHRADAFDSTGELATREPAPSEQAISREQERILWDALETIPENYREPLILYYREHQSIARVAVELELSEEAVRQRLSRGRKLLHERVTAFVEGALARSTPGGAFTASVLGALPLATLPGAAAAAVATGAKSGTLSALLAQCAVVAGAILGPLTGVVGAWSGYRAGLAATRTPAEARHLKRGTIRMVSVSAVMTALILLLLLGGARWWKLDPVVYTSVVISAVLMNFVLVGFMTVRFRREVGALRVAERLAHPEAFRDEQPGRGEPKYYRSSAIFLGIPLVEVRYGRPEGAKLRPAFGWFAFGDVALGLIGAVGPVACAPVAFGALSIGLAAIGGLSLAGFSIGGVALGGFALGGLAIGVVAVGGIALGWTAAIAGVAVAHGIAFGQSVYGAHANDAVASAWLAAHHWLDVRQPEMLLTISLLWLPSVCLTWIMIWRWRVTTRTRALVRSSAS